jgi:15,16-dihydrobiliverdin:ferredoxin oxidoreductase
MLGIDLISLGKSRVLSVIDFQPLHPTEEYSEKYISHLSEIRNKYPGIITYVCLNDTFTFCFWISINRNFVRILLFYFHFRLSDLQGSLSGKIYDDVSWFSKEMLFGRFTNEDKITSVVLPAFKDYLNEYLKLMDSAMPDHTMENMNIVENRQKEYDTYRYLFVDMYTYVYVYDSMYKDIV